MANFAVTLVRGPAWNELLGIREQAGWDEHAEFMDWLLDDGFEVMGGPVGNFRQTLHLVEAASEAEVRARFGEDPWASAGLLEIGSIEPWLLWLNRSAASELDE